MIVLKWICFSIMALSSFLNIWKAISSDDSRERGVSFIAFIITSLISFYIFFN